MKKTVRFEQRRGERSVRYMSLDELKEDIILLPSYLSLPPQAAEVEAWLEGTILQFTRRKGALSHSCIP